MSSPATPVAVTLLVGTTAAPASAPVRNQLQNHPSPYLAMQGGDPVHWQTWSAETVRRGRQEDRLLLVSVGYFSCHWSHVMQQESYQDKKIAALINRYFIAVKVDRELRAFLVLTLENMADQGCMTNWVGGSSAMSRILAGRSPTSKRCCMTTPDWRLLARRTLDFMLAEMRDANKAFIASLSAVDDAGVEGGYYLWQNAGLTALLTDAALPSASACLVESSLRLVNQLGDGVLRLQALQALYVGMTDLSGQPFHHASHLNVLRNYPPDSAAAR